MEEIKGEKYKLAGITVRTKGTLVDVFATFAGVNEDIEALMAERAAWKPEEEEKKSPKPVKTDKPRTVGSILDDLTPLPRWATLPGLSVEDLTDAIVGKSDLRVSEHHQLELTDKSGVIADLGPEKLAQVLVEMGRVRKQVLTEGQETFVALKPKKAPAPKA